MNWISIKDESPAFDGSYLAMISEPQECGNTHYYQEVVSNVFNSWILKDKQELTHWMELPKEPK